MEKLKVFTAFSGYDSQCLGLNRLKDYCPEFDYDLIGWSEIDRGAISAHDALFPEYKDRNYGDISKIDWSKVPDFDLFTYSSPCTDFSSAGKQAGAVEGSGTRSSLLWECRKTIEQKRPKYCLFENVTAILQKKFLPYFEKWQKELRDFGYENYVKVLSSADYGIPQNRQRLFMVSIRKDITEPYYFPEPIGPAPHLYTILENPQDPADTNPKWFRSEWRRTHYIEMEKKALDKLIVPENSVFDYEVLPCGVYCHSSDPFMAPPLYDLARTLKTESIESGIIYKMKGQDWNMRLFSPKECFRLMGLTDEEYDKLATTVKQTHQSRCAGNSIVVNVLFHIFRKMFVDKEPDKNSQYVLF